MDYEKEITALAGETLALQIILSSVFFAARSDEQAGAVLRAGFKAALERMKGVAEQHREESPGQIGKAEQVLKELHVAALGRQANPN